MREIYLLNNGDSVQKAMTECNIENVEVAQDKVLGCRYVITKNGADDIIIVKNYLPMFVYKVSKEDNYLDILARGFKTDANENIQEGDIIILQKPSSIRYVVAPLETLTCIANKFGIDEKDILINNNLNTDKLFVGQILWI